MADVYADWLEFMGLLPPDPEGAPAVPAPGDAGIVEPPIIPDAVEPSLELGPWEVLSPWADILKALETQERDEAEPSIEREERGEDPEYLIVQPWLVGSHDELPDLGLLPGLDAEGWEGEMGLDLNPLSTMRHTQPGPSTITDTVTGKIFSIIKIGYIIRVNNNENYIISKRIIGKYI